MNKTESRKAKNTAWLSLLLAGLTLAHDAYSVWQSNKDRQSRQGVSAVVEAVLQDTCTAIQDPVKRMVCQQVGELAGEAAKK